MHGETIVTEVLTVYPHIPCYVRQGISNAHAQSPERFYNLMTFTNNCSGISKQEQHSFINGERGFNSYCNSEVTFMCNLA